MIIDLLKSLVVFLVFAVYTFNSLEGYVFEGSVGPTHVRPEWQGEFYRSELLKPKKKFLKPYMDLDVSQDWKLPAPAPFQERKEKPGVALNFGFRF